MGTNRHKFRPRSRERLTGENARLTQSVPSIPVFGDGTKLLFA